MADNFFDLGGHSLLAARVISRIRECFDVKVPLLLLFKHSVIREFTGAVLSHREEQDMIDKNELPLLKQVLPERLPLSFAQSRLWFLDQIETGSALYNIYSHHRLHGTLNTEALQQALDSLVNRHESLRTFFKVIQGEPEQLVSPAEGMSLPVIDLSHMAGAALEDKAEALVLEETRSPFDLTQGPLLRVKLLRLKEQEHILLVTMHHIISDRWSMGILYQELNERYKACLEDRDANIIALPIQYIDYALWQYKWLSGAVYERQIQYWQKQLEDIPPLLPLPYDKLRPSVQQYQGAHITQQLPVALVEKIKILSRQEGCTPFTVFLAAFQILLYRYTGQERIAVGTPIANRMRREVEGLIGFFVDTLVMSTNHEGNPPFRAMLKRVRETALEAYDHQDLPFEKLVEALNPERNLSYSPLFQVMFAYQNMQSRPLSLDGINVTPLRVESGTSKFDLTLTLVEEEEGLRAEIEYSTDLFERETIERMIGHYQVLLEGIVADPETLISALPLLTDQEQAQLLEWNATAVDYSKDQCIHQLFEAQVLRTPDKVAVVYEDQSLTYDELNRRANQLAHLLRERGVGAEVLVGLYLERSLEMLVALLGVLKAGGAYLPLDTRHPQARLVFMLEDTQVRIVLTMSAQSEKLLETGFVETICLDRDEEEIAGHRETNLVNQSTAENLAYVIYTSGSTGQPKGVQVQHGNVARLFAATDSWFHFNETDVWTLFHSFAFDFSVWEIWGALLHGGKLVVLPFMITRSADEFYDVLCEQRVTVLNQTPSAFQQIIQVEEHRFTGKESKKKKDDGELVLRYIIFGGEALNLQNLKPWFQRHGDSTPQLVNMYGITETTVHVTYHPLKESDLVCGTASPIGRPIPDLQVHLLDGYQQPVPIGVPGEIYVGGAGVARGYLNRPDLTEERFIQNPFSDTSGTRLYRTGDQARYLKGGNIEYLGRLDHQVKIRGFRIELGEIEAVLGQNEAIRECVVVVHALSPEDQRMIAYVVYEQGEYCTITELRGFLRKKLPEYMLPSIYLDIESLPLTSSGKIDRKALPDPLGRHNDIADAKPPETAQEKLIAAIWSEALGIQDMGVQDNFFDLGGHSLLSIRVIAKIEEKIGVRVSITEMFTSTLQQIAAACEREA